MNCPKCNSVLPGDSEFCQFCGTKIEKKSIINVPTKQTINQEEKDTLKQESLSAPVFIASSNTNQTTHESEQNSIKEQHCKKCGGLIDNETKKCTSCGKQHFKFRPIVLAVVLLAVFLVASAGLNVYQYYVGQDNSRLVGELNSKVSSLDNTVSTQKLIISSLNSQVESNKEKAESYDDLISALSTAGNLGYAADNFKSSESVIVVSKNQNNRKFTLTANWSNGGTVSTSYLPSFPCASVSFDNDEWNTSTTMTIKPLRTGITTVTFINDVDYKTFQVVIIVTD